MGSGVSAASETVEAIGALATATEASRAALAGLSPEAVSLARRLCRDEPARKAIPDLAGAHAGAIAEMNDALGQIWPRSSPSRPRNPTEAEGTCRHLEGLIEDGRSALALRLAALNESDRNRLTSEAGHVLDTEARLRQMGMQPSGTGADPDETAARALDALFEETGAKELPDAERIGAELRALHDAVASCHAEASELGSSLGFSDATLAQSCTLAQALARFGHPWTTLMDGTADLEAMAEAFRVRHDALTRLEELNARLTVEYGTAWAGEEANKLAAASVILSNPDDARAASARAYAATLGLSGDDAETSMILRTMARTTQARRNLPPPPARHAELPGLDESAGAAGCARAAAFLTDVADWIVFMEGSAVLGRALSMLRAMPSQARHRILASAPGVASALAPLLAASGRSVITDLPDRLATRLAVIEASVATARLAKDMTLAKRAARSLRERRLALARILAAPGYQDTAADSAEDLVAAWGWMREMTAALPPGIDPSSGFVRATVLPGARRAAEAALAARTAEVEADRAGPGGIEALVKAAAAADLLLDVERARDAVAKTGGWSDVAWLEEEGIEPLLWREALEGRAAEVEPPTTSEDEDATPLPMSAPSNGMVARPAFDFADPSGWASAGLTLRVAA